MAALRGAVEWLSLDAPELLARLPAGVPLADLIGEDFDHYLRVCRGWGYVGGPLLASLEGIDAVLDRMSGPDQAERWTGQALATDPGWLEVRARVRDVLRAAVWPESAPSSARPRG